MDYLQTVRDKANRIVGCKKWICTSDDCLQGYWKEVSLSECKGAAGLQARPSLNPINSFLSGRNEGVSRFRGFMTSENSSMKSNLIFTGSAVLGALAARKFIKKGDKNTNTVLGGAAGLLLGVAITKIIK